MLADLCIFPYQMTVRSGSDSDPTQVSEMKSFYRHSFQNRKRKYNTAAGSKIKHALGNIYRTFLEAEQGDVQIFFTEAQAK